MLLNYYYEQPDALEHTIASAGTTVSAQPPKIPKVANIARIKNFFIIFLTKKWCSECGLNVTKNSH